MDEGGLRIPSFLEGGLEAFLLDQALVAVTATELDGTVRHWNRHAEVLFGFPAEETLGRDLRDLAILPDDAIDLDTVMGRAARGDPWEGDLKLRRKDGSFFWGSLTLSPIRDASGTARGAISVIYDVTGRRRAEERLALQYEISRILADGDDLEATVTDILRSVCQTLGWRFGALWRAEDDGSRLRCVEAWADPEAGIESFRNESLGRTFGMGEGLPGRAWALQEPVWIPDVVVDENFPRAPLAATAGLHGAFAFSFSVRGETQGVFEFLHDEVMPADEDLLLLTGSIGRQLGQSLVRESAEKQADITKARRSAIVDSAFDCVITMDIEGRVVEFNPAAEETFGYRREEAIGRELAELIIPADTRDAHRLGLHRFRETGEGPMLDKRVELTAMRADGSTFPVELAITTVGTDELLFTGYLRDITDRRRFEEAIERLLEKERNARHSAEELTRELNDLQRLIDAALSNLDLDELLEELLNRLTEILKADSLGILVTSEDGSLLHLRAHRGLDVDISKWGNIPLGEGIAGKIAESRSSLVIGDVLAQEGYRPFFEIGQTRSIIGVPMHLEGQLLGVLMAGSMEPEFFSSRHVRLLELAADRVASGIYNAREYTREHRIAVTLQRSLLPEALPKVPGIDLAARYLAGGTGNMVGGDWYDAIALPDHKVGLVIGDVVGKGVTAASRMGQIRSALLAIALESAGPGPAVGRLERLIGRMGGETMATLVYLVFDPERKEVRFTNAGHPPPLLRTPDGHALYLDNDPSPPLGVVEGADHEEWVTTLDSGSELLLYTDGLIETPGANITVGMELLREAMSRAPHDVEGLCDAVLQTVFADRDPADDVALVTLRFP